MYVEKPYTLEVVIVKPLDPLLFLRETLVAEIFEVNILAVKSPSPLPAALPGSLCL